MACHEEILKAYLKGMTLKGSDVVVVFDVMPNRRAAMFVCFLAPVSFARHAEFARAVAGRILEDSLPAVKYFGVLRPEQSDVPQLVHQKVFAHWDTSKSSPPKQRPREERDDPHLSVLAWQSGAVVWPEPLASKFSPDTPEHQELNKIRAELEALWPAATAPAATTTPQAVRAGGTCDFSIDGGAQPVDAAREVDMQFVSELDFKETTTLGAATLCLVFPVKFRVRQLKASDPHTGWARAPVQKAGWV